MDGFPCRFVEPLPEFKLSDELPGSLRLTVVRPCPHTPQALSGADLTSRAECSLQRASDSPRATCCATA